MQVTREIVLESDTIFVVGGCLVFREPLLPPTEGRVISLSREETLEFVETVKALMREVDTCNEFIKIGRENYTIKFTNGVEVDLPDLKAIVKYFESGEL